MIDLALNRRLTKAFIDHIPVELVLVPRTKQKQPGGGYAWVDGAPRPPQTMTLIEPGGVGGIPRPLATSDGIVRVADFELVAEWDAQLDVGDTFTHQGRDWEVAELFYDNGYERRALVTARG